MVADYFTKDELIKKIGLTTDSWDRVIMKELIDNALDAIEPLNEKHVSICINGDGNIGFFDNGTGMTIDMVKQIYDFTVYLSKNRHYITASRGKQGNGLKTIISICHLLKSKLLWHTSEGIILEATIDAENARDGIINTKFNEIGITDKRGVEICDYKLSTENYYLEYMYAYSECNPDVNFNLSYLGEQYNIIAISEPKDKSKNMSLSFYDFDTFKRFVRDTQDSNITYKQFLGDNFGTRIKNASCIKGKIKDIDFKSQEFVEDFINLKSLQSNKQYTLLKNHMLGMPYSMNTMVKVKQDENTEYLEKDICIPCIVEFDIKKTELDPVKGTMAPIQCYINNSISYWNGWSICFKRGDYQVGTRKGGYSRNLEDLLKPYNDYEFKVHIISPYLTFMDSGKTQIDITSFIKDLTKQIRSALSKEKKKFDANIEKSTANRTLIREYLDEAFNMASTNGKYAITPRQIYYKMRELSGIAETKNTYGDFTQNILTEWINNHPEHEDKINFSDRGNYYIGETQTGLGTASVRGEINHCGGASNTFKCFGGLTNDIFVSPEFDLKYEYDKVLYIEKTGFDAIFKAEEVGKKHNMIIISGQGYATRAAKTLLHHFQNQGMKLYCMHDLDVFGVSIIDSLRKPNDKFDKEIQIEDLGITLDDIKKYDIKPEQVDIDEKTKSTYESLNLSYEYQRFFDCITYFQRVELNAFTTEQILEIIDNKLSGINNLPKINISNSLEVDHNTLRQFAFMQLIDEKYHEKLKGIYIPYDLQQYDGQYTVADAKKHMKSIQNDIVMRYKEEIAKNLTF